MILRFVGGKSDGVVIDTDDPPDDWGGIPDGPPFPETVEMHSTRPNRTVYRLVSASPGEVVYQIDPDLTKEYRDRA